MKCFGDTLFVPSNLFGLWASSVYYLDPPDDASNAPNAHVGPFNLPDPVMICFFLDANVGKAISVRLGKIDLSRNSKRMAAISV
jgi:hypothetical protein